MSARAVLLILVLVAVAVALALLTMPVMVASGEPVATSTVVSGHISTATPSFSRRVYLPFVAIRKDASR